MPTEIGISGNTISNSSSGLLVSAPATRTTATETVVAYRNHLSWSRCSVPERRKRMIMDTTPARNTSSASSSARLKAVPSGATTVTGSRSLGKLLEKLALDSATATT